MLGSVLPTYMSVCRVCLVLSEIRRVSDPLELELRMVVATACELGTDWVLC